MKNVCKKLEIRLGKKKSKKKKKFDKEKKN